MNPQANILGPIMQLLPLMLIMPMVGGLFSGASKKAPPLTHSPSRNAAKYALAAIGIAGGAAAGVVAPILIGVMSPDKITDPAAVDNAAKVADYLNAQRKVNIAVGLTSGIGAGVGSIGTGIAAMLAKA